MSWSLLVFSIIALILAIIRNRDSEQFMMILSALLAVFTMLLIPFLGYKYFDNLEITRLYDKEMKVPESDYFNAMQPVIYAYVLGVLIFGSKSDSLNRLSSLRSVVDEFCDICWRNLILLFLALDFLKVLQYIGISELNFVFLALSSAKYGVLLIMILKAKNRWVKLGILCWPLTEAVGSAMFQGYLALIFVVILINGGFKKRLRFLGLTALGLMLLPWLLIAKNELRRNAWGDGGGLTMSEAFDIMVEVGLRESSDAGLFVFSTEANFEVYRRVNQGWLLSAVLEKKEQNEGFVRGLLLQSLAASVIPRFMWPEKPEAGGREKIANYTDLTLSKSTSMNISPFGDIIAEFNGLGAIVISFLYALLVCKLISQMIEFSIAGRISFLILPFILSQVYKVETDIVTVLNFLIKGFVLGLLLLPVQNLLRVLLQRERIIISDV